MRTSTATISSKGQIVLPRNMRSKFSSSIVSLEMNENNQIIISQVHDLGGSLSSYQKCSTPSFDQIRENAWEENAKRNT